MLTREEMARGGRTTASRHDMQAIGRLGGRPRRVQARLVAGILFAHGEKPEYVARQVNINDRTAFRWRRLWREGAL